MRHAGMHWPANANGEHPDRETIYQLPGVEGGCLLMLADSARYWYDEARRRCPLVVWRGLPRPNKLPASMDWRPNAVADEVLNLWWEAAHSGGTEWYTPLNELQFYKESGEQWQGYADMAEKLSRLRPVLRRRLAPSVNMLFPPWVPQDDAAKMDEWATEAEQWDGLVLHVYDSADSMRTRYYEYRQRFPTKPIFIGEWNANHTGNEEVEALEALAEIAARDPLFLGAAYYIWETRNPGEEDLSVWGNNRRLQLFQNPPGIPSVEPPAEPPEEPSVVDTFPLPVDDAGNEWAPSYQDIVDAVPTVAQESNLRKSLLGGLFFAESGLELHSFERWSIWTDEAKGYIASRNKAGLQNILDRCAAANDGTGTNDISFGPGHQAYYWWEGYKGNRGPGDPYRYDVDEILLMRKQLIQDHGYAMRLAAKQLKAYADKYGQATNEALYHYNKPDGSASDGVKANYDRGRTKALSIWPDDVVVPNPPPIVIPDGGTRFDDYHDPEPAGTLSVVPLGVILHGSRSGRASNPLHAEYAGTANWEVNNPDSLGWHATIGEGEVAIHMDAKHWGWNARSPASQMYLAVEFAQPTVANPISDLQVKAFCDWYRLYVLPVWPSIPRDFPTHAEVENWGQTGAHDGKTDVFPYLDARADELRHRIVAGLGGTVESPAPPPTEGSTCEEDLAAARNLVGLAYNEDGVVLPPLDKIAAGKITKAEMVQEASSVAAWLRTNRS
jgi:hypothetical protein